MIRFLIKTVPAWMGSMLVVFFWPYRSTQNPAALTSGGFKSITATDDLLGTEKWSAGPALVALTMRGPWTIGMLANHNWSYAGNSDRQDINVTFFQPYSFNHI